MLNIRKDKVKNNFDAEPLKTIELISPLKLHKKTLFSQGI